MSKSDGVVNGEEVSVDFAELATAFNATTRSLNALREEFSTYRSRARWRTALSGIVLAVILSLTASMALVSHSNAHVIDSINDCTQPGGECYEQSQKRGAERTAPFVELICNATPPERRKPPCKP